MSTEVPPDHEEEPQSEPNRVATLGRWLRGYVGILAASGGLLVLAIVPMFVTFSSTQIKSIFDQFTGGCVLVLDKQMGRSSGKVLVTGRIAGAMPERLNLTFRAREGELNTVQFDEAFRGDRIDEPDDLTFHPAALSSCPGPLCEDLGPALDGDTATIVLTDLRPEFTLRFSVRIKPFEAGQKLTTKNLAVFSKYDSGFKGDVCRIEPQRWFNFWVWATPMKKALLFIFVIVAGGLLVRWATSHSLKKDSA